MCSRLLLVLVLPFISGAVISPAAAQDAAVCVNGAPDPAIAACTRVIAAKASSTAELVLAHNFRGMQFLKKDDFDGALADFDKASKLDPNSAVPHSSMGTLYLRKGDYEAAIAAVSEAIRLGPRASDYSLRGDIYLKKGQHDLAVKDYNSAIEINPSLGAAFSGRGQAWLMVGEHDRAIDDFGIAIRLDANDPQPYFLRGRSYAKKGEYERAIVDLSQAISLKHPRVAVAYLARGEAYETRGDLRQALSDYHQAAANLDPKSTEAKEAEIGIQSARRKLAARTEPPAPKLRSTGSGFAVNKSGHVLTNHHVIEGCAKVQLRSSAGVIEASIVTFDEANDLALLRTDPSALEPLTLRDGRGIRQAESVVAVGFPLSDVLASSSKVTVGTVSALAGLGDDTRFLQFSAPIQPGNSGGPLLDLAGNLVGIVAITMDAAAALEKSGLVPQNVNFAIKSNIAREFLDAKGIPYEAVTSAARLEPADVAEKGVRATVLVECYK